MRATRDLAGHTAFVTGAAGGIGRAVCERLAADGAAVIVADIDENAALRTAQAIAEGGSRAHSVGLDVRDRAGWERALDAIPAAFGRPDIFVNVAGIIRDASLLKMSDDDWTAVIDTNLRGSWLGCQMAVAVMKGRGWGRIVNIASTSIYGTFGQSNYASAKAGVVGLTRTVALEAARHGVLVNAVAPGVVDTAILAGIPDAVREGWVKSTPVGRLGRPEDIANVVAFLASDDSAYITGQTIVVDGGATTGDY